MSGIAQRLAEAYQWLQRGDARAAQSIVSSILERSPRDPGAMHLLALCRKASGDLPGALAAFESALALAGRDPQLLGNYANLLCRVGRHADTLPLYRRAVAAAPGWATGWLNLGLAELDVRDPSSALTSLGKAVKLQPGSAAAWQALGLACRATGDLESAEFALRRALGLEPGNGACWVNLGVVLRLIGRPAESLRCYAQARNAGFSGPELLDAEASAQLDLGDPAAALRTSRELVRMAPGYVAGHELLANLLWEHHDRLAPDVDPVAAFRQAVDAQPAHRPLREAFIRFLFEANRAEEALLQVRELRRQGAGPELVVLEAQALTRLGQFADADHLFSQAYQALPDHAGFLTVYAEHLLRRRDPAASAARAEKALAIEPFDQRALAYLGTAWRLLDDQREDWLCGYDRLVAEVAVETPREFRDERAFLAALEATLVSLHKAEREPVNQSLRGGSQTSGRLFGRHDPVIDATRHALERAIASYIERLPVDARHPFLRRVSSRIRFAGSWSVRLSSAGHHVSHVHQEGWISSAFYVSLPPSVRCGTASDPAGCIQFGEPPAELGFALEPRRVIRPREGQLVLFPSYLWHGTIPFQDTQPRLTVAFDVVPSAGRALDVEGR